MNIRQRSRASFTALSADAPSPNASSGTTPIGGSPADGAANSQRDTARAGPLRATRLGFCFSAAVMGAFGVGVAFGLGAASGVATAFHENGPIGERQLVSGESAADESSEARASAPLPNEADTVVLPRDPQTTATPSENESEHPTRPARERIGRTAFESTVFIQAGAEYGAGVVVSDSGHIVTCLHVVHEAREVWLVLPDGTRHAARVLERDPKLDLALLVPVELPPTSLRPAPLGSVTSVSVAQEVFSVGAPHKMTFSLNRGIVSYVARPFAGTFYLQTDIPTNGGNSGGPVLNERGEVIGISSFILRGTQGLAFALPVDYVRERFGQHFSPSTPTAEPNFRQWLSRWAEVGVRVP